MKIPPQKWLLGRLPDKKYAVTEKSLFQLNKEPKIHFKKIRDRNGYRGGGGKWPL